MWNLWKKGCREGLLGNLFNQMLLVIQKVEEGVVVSDIVSGVLSKTFREGKVFCFPLVLLP